MKNLSLFASFIASATAALPSTYCPRWSVKVSEIAIELSATPFCSSFLKIPAATLTVKSTSTVTPVSALVSKFTTITLSATAVDQVAMFTENITTTISTTISSGSTATQYTTIFSPTQISCLSRGTTLKAITQSAEGFVRNARQADSFTPTTITTSSVETSSPAAITTSSATVVPTPPALIGEDTTRISSLCSCLSLKRATTTNYYTVTAKRSTIASTQTFIPTLTRSVATTITSISTVTVSVSSDLGATTTTTITVVQPTPTALSGLKYYVYQHNLDFNVPNPGIDAANFKASNSYAKGVVSNINAIQPRLAFSFCLTDRGCSPESQIKSNEYVGILMQGYLYSPRNQTATIAQKNNVDNYLALWSGDAYSKYTNDNADWTAKRAGPDDSKYVGGSKDYSLSEYSFKPFTFLYINGGGMGQFYVDLTVGGTRAADTSGYFVPDCGDAVRP